MEKHGNQGSDLASGNVEERYGRANLFLKKVELARIRRGARKESGDSDEYGIRRRKGSAR